MEKNLNWYSLYLRPIRSMAPSRHKFSVSFSVLVHKGRTFCALMGAMGLFAGYSTTSHSQCAPAAVQWTGNCLCYSWWWFFCFLAQHQVNSCTSQQSGTLDDITHCLRIATDKATDWQIPNKTFKRTYIVMVIL